MPISSARPIPPKQGRYTTASTRATLLLGNDLVLLVQQDSHVRYSRKLKNEKTAWNPIPIPIFNPESVNLNVELVARSVPVLLTPCPGFPTIQALNGHTVCVTFKHECKRTFQSTCRLRNKPRFIFPARWHGCRQRRQGGL